MTDPQPNAATTPASPLPTGARHPSSAVARVSPAVLRTMLADGAEIALIDVREGGPFSRAHLLLASNLPLSLLEVRAPQLLPRRTVRIVLVDDDDGAAGAGLAARAARVLAEHGYSDLVILAGGVTGWAQDGFELFSGTNVPSKAFGEHVEHACETPRIEPALLQQWRAEGRDVVVVDSRPLDEYRMVSIPGAADCPGAELVLRVPGLVASPETIVVVNCAGRTRSIIGAQSLRNAGLPNPVYALKNGTMGWHLAGLKTDKGRDNLAVEPQGPALERAQELARDVALRFALRFIGLDELRAMQADASRTTQVFDVRLPEAYLAGHLPGSLSAPGGQLVQATDTFVPVRGARIVLVDRHQVQAVMTAHWLGQMGWTDVHVLVGALDAVPLAQGLPATPALGEERLSAPSMTSVAVSNACDASVATVIDVGDSFDYRRARIPGASYAMRSRLADVLHRFPRDACLVFCCADGRVSRFAAQDAIDLGYAGSRWLAGGRAAWRAAGLATEACAGDDDPLLLTATDDMWYPPWARSAGVEAAMQQYLTWELNLLAQLEREPYLRFASPA